MGVSWYLLSFPDLWGVRGRLDLYCKFKVIIDEIIIETDTMGDIKLVEESMQKVIGLLSSIEDSEYKLSEYIKILSRD
ncbi:hypothetical protein BG07_1442 [Bacillus pseudomycoides]|uniref:hypothetical protein n=1 Tax=Bacillus pseudomycoides TaxID=64104 RepID=UPI0004ED83BB|nr:hypothetical protein [Bacillus pseudomycoides]AIK38143.1 hypothetical protein DJ92_3502 [Bacillus pseudomycoides]AJI16297.1 hypothetical protein BG07_1442 [Bacillus pseudomycoides]